MGDRTAISYLLVLATIVGFGNELDLSGVLCNLTFESGPVFTRHGESRCIRAVNPVVLLLLATYGLRRGEVAALRLEDLDFEKELIRITRTKQRRTQQCPLIGVVGNVFVQYIQQAPPM